MIKGFIHIKDEEYYKPHTGFAAKIRMGEYGVISLRDGVINYLNNFKGMLLSSEEIELIILGTQRFYEPAIGNEMWINTHGRVMHVDWAEGYLPKHGHESKLISIDEVEE